jgi:hypothetical protein
MKLHASLLCLTLLVPGIALANQCPALIAEIDAALESNHKLSEEKIEEITDLRDEGADLHQEGKHDASVEALSEALDIIKAGQ